MRYCNYDVENEGEIDILAVVGPTATGKTKLAISLAKSLEGEVVSADSIQIYKDLNVGTAKPTEEELGGANYHLVNFVDPRSNSSFSVASYVTLAKEIIVKIKKIERYPILCGGTGLYIDSLLNNINFFENTSDLNIRRKLKAFLDIRGKDYIYAALTKIDPETASKFHKNNAKRTLRALEFFAVTGYRISDQNALSRREKLFNPIYVGLKYKSKEDHIKKINSRVDKMFKNGLVEEVRRALDENYSKIAMSAIGYKEVVPYIKGEKSLPETIERVKISTRQYAKRQMTWFKRNKEIKWFNVDDYQNFEDLVSDVESYVKKEKNKCKIKVEPTVS